MECSGGKTPCKGRGTCKTMSELAALTESNGVLSAKTYGTDPNKAATWDAHMSSGCHCAKVLRSSLGFYNNHEMTVYASC